MSDAQNLTAEQAAQARSALLELISTPVTGDTGDFEKTLLPTPENPNPATLPVPVPDAVAPVSSDVPPAPQTGTDVTVPLENGVSSKESDTYDPNRKITKEEAEEIRRGEKEYREALAFVKDAIAPSMMRVDATKIQIGDVFVRSFFTYAYPDFLEGNWLSPLINWDVKFDMSMFVYPIESAFIMKYLRKRLTELHSERSINADKGLINDPALEAQIQDVEELRASLTRGQERYFHFSIYITIYGESEDHLKKLSNTFDTLLSGRNILTKQAFLRSEQAFTASGPFAKDEVGVYRNISTRGLSTTFPFTSNSLSQDDGILYGINTHNNSLVIFDRFRTENANMVVFAKSG
ncbi:MAG: hypothetical protein QMC36_02340 [Patescibacteria group bacterium]